MTPEEVRAARRSVDQMLQSPALKTAEGQSQLLMSIKSMRDILEQSEDLLDHTRALEARIAAVRELHAGIDVDAYAPECKLICSECQANEMDVYGWYVPWPCPTFKILDGIE